MRFTPRNSVIPGFGLTMGYTLFYLTLLVLIPLSMLFFKTATLTWPEFLGAVTSPRVIASYRLSFGASFLAAVVNVVFGLVVAWVLVRYRFPGRAAIDMLIDLPFALPTAVAGIALTAAFGETGIIGRFLTPLGIHVVFTPLGVIVAMIFIGIPFVVRSVQPVLKDLDREMEEAGACLGANRAQIFFQIILPALLPALLSGFGMAFARGVGEYGSIVFISGNMPMRTEIAPLMVITKLEQYDYAGATAIAVVMLITSFVILWGINQIQGRIQKRQTAPS